MFGGIPRLICLSTLGMMLAIIHVDLAQANLAQDDASNEFGSARSPSNARSSQQPRGGIVQQFKSFTSNLFGDDKPEPAEKAPQPTTLEAQRRRILPPVIQNGRSNNSRNRSSSPSPMQDPPSLPPIQNAQKYRALPQVEGAAKNGGTPNSRGNSNASSRNALPNAALPPVEESSTAEDEVAQQPNLSVSKSQSSRRKNRSTFVDTPASPNTSREELSLEEGEETSLPEVNTLVPSVPRKPAPGAKSSGPASGFAPSSPKGESFRLEGTSSPNATSNPAARQSNTLSPPSPSSSNTMIQMGLPHVELALNGTTSLRVNEFCSYELLATNRDQIQLNGLIVRVGLPSSVQVQPDPKLAQEIALEKEEDGSLSLIWQLEQLAPTQTRSLKFDLKATQPEHFALDIEWTALPQATQATIQVSQPVLQLALEGPAEVRFGSPELYRLRVKNPGNAVVKDVEVTLTAEPYGGNSSNIGDVPAGGERLIEVELTFQQAGQIPIIAHAKSIASGLESSSQIDIQVQKAELVAQWQGPEKHYQGSLAEYRLQLINQGNIAAENIVCSMTVPESAILISIPDGARIVGKEVQWNILRMDPSFTHESLFEIRMDQAGEHALQLQVQGSAGGAMSSEFVAKVEAIADLKLSVVDPPAPAPLGKPVTYEIVVKNRGSKPATGVRVLAQFSNGIEPVDAQGHSFQLVPGQVLFDPIPAIAPGEERVVKVQANAAEAGMHRFRAEITCDDSDTQLMHEAATRYLATGRIEGQNGTLRR